jgi:hypothetical protein
MILFCFKWHKWCMNCIHINDGLILLTFLVQLYNVVTSLDSLHHLCENVLMFFSHSCLEHISFVQLLCLTFMGALLYCSSMFLIECNLSSWLCYPFIHVGGNILLLDFHNEINFTCLGFHNCI